MSQNDHKIDMELKVLMSELGKRELTAQDETLEIRDRTFKQQDAFVVDQSRALVALCTRRAGKSNGLAMRFWRTMLRYPGCYCPYIALTRPSAENIMWPILEEQAERYKIKANFTISDLSVTLSNGSRLQLLGADMKNFIKRIKGIKTPGAAVDEAQDFGPHIEQLIDDVLGPATLDFRDGWIAVCGTPGAVPNGFYYDITDGGKYGYSVHRWSLFDNPYLPNPRDFVADLVARKGWTHDNPTLLREYYGRWILDLEALVVRYQGHLNHFSHVPDVSGRWSYVIGVDLGFDDADAIAVIGYNEKSRAAYLVEELVEREQGITELAHRIDELVRKYNPDRIVIDTGGLGKKIAEELRRRFSLPVVAAEKTRKVEYLEILNDALRNQKFYAQSSSRFAQDAGRLKWDYEKCTPDKMVISDSFHSDIIDAVLYAFRESMHWLYEPEPVKVNPGTPAWLKGQEDEVIARLESEVEKKKHDDPWADGSDMPWSFGDEP